MTSRTIGRAALVVAAGLLLFASPASRAATGETAADEKTEAVAKPIALTKATTAKPRRTSQSRAAKLAALKAAKKAELAAKQSKAKTAALKEKKEKELPAAVANANALMTSPDARGSADMTDAAPLEAAAADQLTELGRALTAPPTDDAPARIATQLVLNDQPQLAMAQSAPATALSEPAPAVSQVRSSPSGDPWAQSSLVGKLFIAVGGMLTLASAARMLVA